jgi:hypothetical protein
VIDLGAGAQAIGFDQLYKYLENKGLKGAGAISAIRGWLEAVGNLGRSLWLIGTLNGEITLDAGGRLNRTHLTRVQGGDAAFGQKRVLRGRVKLDVGDAQLINCFRMMTAVAGIDISVPNDGSLATPKSSGSFSRAVPSLPARSQSSISGARFGQTEHRPTRTASGRSASKATHSRQNSTSSQKAGSKRGSERR